MKTYILSLLLLLTSFTGYGQDTAIVDLPREGVNFLNGSKTLTEIYGTVAKAKAARKHLFGWAAYKGMTDAEVMSFRFAEAVWHDGFWKGENGNYTSPAPAHAWRFIVGAGKFTVSGSLPVASGIYEGQSSRFSDQNGVHSYGGTEWVIDHTNWKSRYWPDKIIMRSANWGAEGNGAWVHHVVIRDMCFNGDRQSKWYVKDGKEGAGVALWDAAEVMSVERCYFIDFDKDGLLFARGTPARSFNCSFFRCNRYGMACMGSGNFMATGISGDENGLALIGGYGAFGRPGNAQITIVGFKHETSTSDPFRPWKGTPLLHFEGWVTAVITGGTFASAWTTPYTFIHINPTINTSSVEWSGVQFFGNAPKCILYDELKATEYAFVGNAYATPMEQGHWHKDYGLKNDWVTIPASVRAMKGGRLQHVGTDGATSWATAGLYDITGGVVAPPVTPPVVVPPVVVPPVTPPVTAPTGTIGLYTFSSGTAAAITGTGGNMTRTHGSTTMSGGKLTNANASTSYSVAWKGSTVYTFTGLTWNGDMSYRLLVGLKDTDGQGRGIMVRPDGSLIDNRVSQGDKVIAPAGTIKSGKVNVTVTIAPMDATFFGASPGSGNSWLGSLEELKVQ